jgi:threonine/homoserine/homoserine lactone efflux protein
MSNSVLAAVVKPVRVGKWGLMLLGVVCLGVGLLSTIGTLVDLDIIFADNLNGWTRQVIVEIGMAVTLVGFGSWSLWRGSRSVTRHH